ncbi:hypothetical protein V2I01_30585 [Micromonospora sp. BRA006-A]|nr:hypothetical protein [Micromonospora sp. BRA006-A]
MTAALEAVVGGRCAGRLGCVPRSGRRPARVVDLPTYAFDHTWYWPEAAPAAAGTHGEALDGRFWAAVESGDPDVVGGELGVGADEPFSAVLPKLAQWRRAAQQRSTVDSWRYRVVWRRQDVTGNENLTGSWLVLMVPARRTTRCWPGWLSGAPR